MNQVRNRRARIAAAASAAAIAGGVALSGLVSGGQAAPIADGTVVSDVVAPATPTASVVHRDSSRGGRMHTNGTRMG